MDWEIFMFGAIGTVLTVLVTWAAERFVAFLNSKIKNGKATQYLSDAMEIVVKAVKSTHQTYVQALKETNTFDAVAQQQALQAALKQAQSQMSCELKEYINSNFGDITDWITSQIESSLFDLKYKAKNASN